MAAPHFRSSLSPLSVFLILSAVGCSGKDSDSAAPITDGWVVPSQDLGPPRTGSPDADLTDRSALWFVAAHFLPGIDWDDPTVDVPLYVFDTIAMDPGVADSGSCPYEQLDGSQTTWRSDCRSTQGYEWVGSLVRDRWEADGLEYTRWDSDIQIVADVEGPEFERLSLQGAMVYVRGDGQSLDHAVQANVEVSLQGYWNRTSAGDPREAAWQSWSWTGRDEQRPDGTHRVEGTAQLAGFGTVGLSSAELTVSDACGNSPTGVVELNGAQSVQMVFHGETDCRQCADVSDADGASSEVCAP
jgi:hypothetical protein